MRKIMLLILSAALLYAQPSVSEQMLESSGGDAVAMNGEYAIVGDADNHIVHFYRLDYSTFQWVSDGSYQGSIDNGNLGFSVAIDGNIAAAGSPQFSENRIFRFRGANTKEFDEYLIATDSWVSHAQTPDTIGHGGALAWGGGNYIYAFRGENGGINSRPTSDFYIYDIANDSWSSGPSAPKKVGKGGALAWDGGNYIYAFRGDKNKDFWRFNISANSWETLADAPNQIGYGGALVVVNGAVYGTRGDGSTFGSSKTFYRYDVDTNSWTTLADIPKGVGKGGSLASDGTFIYLTRGNDGTLTDKKKFYAYDIAADSWSERAEMPNGVGKGGAMVYDGTFLYVQRGDTSFFGGNNNFWRYDFVRDKWLGDLQEPPGNTGGGGALTVVKDAPGEGMVYVFERNSATNLWERKLRISSDNPQILDNLGYAVALHNRGDGTAAVVMGAPGFAGTGGTGSATVVTYDSGVIPVSGNLAVTLTDNAPAGSVHFGSSMAMKGDIAIDPEQFSVIVGDRNYSSNDGAAYVYDSNGSALPAYPGNMMVGTAGSHLGRSVAIDTMHFTNGLAAVAEDNRNSFWTGGSTPWAEFAFEGTLAGAVAIDDRTILSTNAPLGNVTPTTGLLHFFPMNEDLSLVSHALTEYQLGSTNPGVATDADMYRENAIVNDPAGDRAIVTGVPCGLRPTHLVENEWAIVSAPCDTGGASIADIFGDDIAASGGATYCQTDNPSEVCNWVMYKDGPDYTGHSADNVRVAESEPMELGRGYWIIADHNVTLRVDDNVNVQRTPVDPNAVSYPHPTVGGYYEMPMPDSASGTVKKIMIGNPFPRTFKWQNLYVFVSTDWYPIADQYQIVYDHTGYVYDVNTPDIASGQNYRAITAAGTPGFSDEIKPYQGVWIKDLGAADLTGVKLAIPFMK